MSTKTLAIAATAALIAALTTTSAAAAPASESPAEGAFLGWFNDFSHWGYLTDPAPGTCHTLNPPITEDAALANFSPYTAAFYPGDTCEGQAAFDLAPHSALAGAGQGAASVLLTDEDDAPPTNPGPLPPRPPDTQDTDSNGSMDGGQD